MILKQTGLKYDERDGDGDRCGATGSSKHSLDKGFVLKFDKLRLNELVLLSFKFTSKSNSSRKC